MTVKNCTNHEPIDLKTIREAFQDPSLKGLIQTGSVTPLILGCDSDHDGKVTFDEYVNFSDLGLYAEYTTDPTHEAEFSQLATDAEFIKEEVNYRNEITELTRGQTSQKLCDYFESAVNNPLVKKLDGRGFYFCRGAQFTNLLKNQLSTRSDTLGEVALIQKIHLLPVEAREEYINLKFLSDVPAVRSAAVREIGSVMDIQKRRLMEKALKDPDVGVKCAAVSQVKGLSENERVEFLKKAVDTHSTEVSKEILVWLEYIPQNERLYFVSAALEDGITEEVANVVHTISEYQLLRIIEDKLGGNNGAAKNAASHFIKYALAETRAALLNRALELGLYIADDDVAFVPENERSPLIYEILMSKDFYAERFNKILNFAASEDEKVEIVKQLLSNSQSRSTVDAAFDVITDVHEDSRADMLKIVLSRSDVYKFADRVLKYYELVPNKDQLSVVQCAEKVPGLREWGAEKRVAYYCDLMF